MTPDEAMAKFLVNTVNLPPSSLEKLEEHVTGLWSALTNSDELQNPPTDWQQQGSWAYSTIIKPPSGGEFDADIVLEFDDAGIAPATYLTRVQRALEAHGVYAGKTTLKTRCVRVQYAGEHHVDLVPLVSRGGKNYIANRVTGEFERAEPVGYATWFTDRDEQSGNQLHKVVRLMKYLRDTSTAHNTRSVILTTLLGTLVTDGQGAFTSTTAALDVLVANLNVMLSGCATKPSLPDPACPEVTFDHRWTQAQFEALKSATRDIAARVRSARSATTPEEATRRWRDLFGTDFPEVTRLEPSGTALVLRAPEEEMPQEKFRAVRPAYEASIRVEVLATRGRKAKLMGRTVERHRKLRFTVDTNAPADCEVYWKVRNRGREATLAGSLRGAIVPGQWVHEEDTLYRGSHWIAVYLVRGGEVVAQATRLVTIR